MTEHIIKKNPNSKNQPLSSSVKRPNNENPKGVTTNLTSSMNVGSGGKKSDPSVDVKRAGSAYPSELKTIDLLIAKTGVKLSNVQKSELGFFREVGLNIYEVLSFGYIEQFFKMSDISHIATIIDCMKSPDYHILTNRDLIQSNKRISKETREKYISAHNALIALFEEYLDILLNDITKRVEVIYDFYSKCAKYEDIKLACNAFIRGYVAGFVMNNRKKINENYKIFNLEENDATSSDFDLITYSTDIVIQIYDAMKNYELKVTKTMKYGIDGQPFGHLRIISYGFNYYILYEKDQKPLLEGNIIKNSIVQKKPEIIEKIIENKDSKETKETKETKENKENKEKEEKNKEKEEKRSSNKQEKPEERKEIMNAMVSGSQTEEKKLTTEVTETCQKCQKRRHSKQLFMVSVCKHFVCFDCMVRNYYSVGRFESLSHLCPNFSCHSRFYDDEIQEYFSQIQINESITMSAFGSPQKEKKENPLKPMEIDSESSVIDLQPKVRCVICKKNTPQSEIFTNPECLHCFCYECASNKLIHRSKYSNYNLCPDQMCNKNISQKLLERFLHDYHTQDNKKNVFETTQTCSACNKTFKISMQYGTDLEFFNCKACKVTSCLTHNAPLNHCFCYCESCNIRTEADWMKPSCRNCPDCKRKFCLLCKDSISKCECYCKTCESILETEKNQLVCRSCEDNCVICGIKTNERSRVVGFKCKHTYCRGCVFSKLEDFGKENCLKKAY